MKRGRSLPVVAGAVLAVVGSGTIAMVGGTAGATSSLSLSQLESNLVRTHNMLPGLAHAKLLGTTSPSTMLTVDVELPTPNQAAENALLHDEYTAGNPLYHQFISPKQFDQMFHVSTSTLTATENWARSTGLAVSYISGTGNMLTLRGTTAQYATLMHTTFGNYAAGSYRFIANQLPPQVPAALGILNVVGLNTLQKMTPTDALDPTLVQGKSVPAVTHTAAVTSYLGSLVPQDLWGAYDQPSTDEGQGEISGMFGSGDPDSIYSDLRVYEARMGLPQVPIRVVSESQFTSPPTPNDNNLLGDDEWTLDNEALDSMAPKMAQQDLYFSSTELDADQAVMFADWANDANGPKQMNASFGECESDPTSPYDNNLPSLTFGQDLVGNEIQQLGDTFLEQAVAEGRTFFTAAGDNGGSCPAIILPILSAGNGVFPAPAAVDQWYPCASAYAVCVGGTVLTTNGTSNPTEAGVASTDYTASPHRVNETAWAFTGGGPADNVPEPSYQDGVSAINKPCASVLQPDGAVITPGTICRGVPDIADLSGNGLEEGEVFGSNGLELNFDMLPLADGGTSLSSPLAVGMWTRIEAAAPATAPGVYGGLGFANETIYAIGKGKLGNYSRDFYDVTAGDLPTGNFYELPAKGWDYTTGWGVFDVANIIRDVDHDPSLLPTHPNEYAKAPRVNITPTTTCDPPLTGPLGNAYDETLGLTYPGNNDSQLNITQATIEPSKTGNNLIVSIYGPGLSLTGPPDNVAGYNFYLTWLYKGTTYYAGAEVDPGQQLPATPATNSIPAPVSAPLGSVVYGDGAITTSSLTFSHVDAGYFVNHTFTIIVPMANVGSPPPGARLLWPFAYSNLPDGVLLPLALDVAAAAEPSYQVAIGGYC